MLCELSPFCQGIQDEVVGTIHRLIQNHCHNPPPPQQVTTHVVALWVPGV